MTGKRKGTGGPAALVIGVLLSCGLGVFFYFRTDLKTGLATFAGLIGVTISLQVQSMLQEARSSEELARQQRLFSKAEAIDWFPEKLDEMLSSMQLIQECYPGTMVEDVARREFGKSLAQMKNLQVGHYDTPFEENWLLYALTRKTKKLLATSVEEIDLRWWQSPAGENYWRLNEEALRKKGVEIKRIFIYRQWTDVHESLAKKQHDARVQVMRVHYLRISANLRLDMIIWGNECGFTSNVNSMGEDVIINNYTFVRNELDDMIEKYKEIESCAEVWTPAESAGK